MVERLGEMRKGRREMIEKGSREGIEKEVKRSFEEEGLRELDPTLQCSHCFFQCSGYDKLELKHQNLFLQAYRKHYFTNMSWCETECKKNVPSVKQNVMNLEVFILGRQKKWSEEKEGMGEREKKEDWERE